MHASLTLCMSVCVCAYTYFHLGIFQVPGNECAYHVLIYPHQSSHTFLHQLLRIFQTFFGFLARGYCGQYLNQESTFPQTAFYPFPLSNTIFHLRFPIIKGSPQLHTAKPFKDRRATVRNSSN